MGGHLTFRRLAAALGCLVAAFGVEARAQSPLAGLTPQFPYGPCYAAPLEAEPPGTTVEWLGADVGSLAVFPDGVSTFWAFGDSFLGPRGARDRSRLAARVVNTIAVATVEADPRTGGRVFSPRYYYRGNFTCDVNNPLFTTNNPAPFFLDPEAYSNAPNNTPNNPPDPRYRPNNGVVQTTPLTADQYSRFFVEKAIFVGSKLLVFVNRVNGNSLSGGLSSSVARINNACTADGHPTDPRTWQIDYLKLADVGNPFLGAEAIVVGDAMLVYCTYTRPEQLGPLTVAARIPIGDLLTAPAGSNLAPKIRYLNKDQMWAATATPGNPIGTPAECHDVGIPNGGGFTVRPKGDSSWRVVYVDNRVDPGHVRMMEGPAPLGPWSNVRRVFRFPELDPTNLPFDPASRVHGYNTGIYCRAMNEASLLRSSKCYQAYEVPQFSTDPDRLVTFTYASDRGSCIPPPGLKPTDPGFAAYFPPGCQPGQPGFWAWDNNFYRVKGVPDQAPYPLDAAGPGPATAAPAPRPSDRLNPPPLPTPPEP